MSVSFKAGIFRIFKQVHPDQRIKASTLEEINHMVNYIGVKIIEAANVSNVAKTLTSRNILSGVRLVLSGELAKHAESEGVKAVRKYMSEGTVAKRSRVTKGIRAGLQFAPSRALALIRKNTHSDRVGATASVYLAAVLEYLSAQILELAGNDARYNKYTTVMPQHVAKAIRNDDELARLFKDTVFSKVAENLPSPFKASTTSKGKTNKTMTN